MSANLSKELKMILFQELVLHDPQFGPDPPPPRAGRTAPVLARAAPP